MLGHGYPRSGGRRRRPAGFSLIELLVGLAVTSMLLLAILRVFDAGSKIARVETQVADLQQSLRAGHGQITRIVRMAGRGGLALTVTNAPAFQGPALSFRNDAGVGADSGEIAVGFVNSPLAVTGSDILIARGVFNTPVYQIDTLDPEVFTLRDSGGNPTGDPGRAASGSIVVRDMTPSGLPQDLAPLRDAFAAAVPEALVLVSPLDERLVAVVEFDAANTVVGANQVSAGFKVQRMTHPEYRDLYGSGTGPQPVLPPGLTEAAFLGIVEEYRFYVRQPTPPTAPSLSMARIFPGTETPYLGTLTNAKLDLADHILDMQLALAFDSPLGPAAVDRNGDGDVDEADMEIFEAADGQNDDWLFNTDADDPTAAPWAGAGPQPELFFIRLSLLARTGRRERDYQTPRLQAWEDVAAARILDWNTFPQRMYKRRLRQTIIELRNL